MNRNGKGFDLTYLGNRLRVPSADSAYLKRI